MENRKTWWHRHEAGPTRQAVGRIVLWAVIGLVLVRGVGSILADQAKAPASNGQAAAPRGSGFPMREAEAFAVRFARAYLEVTPRQPRRYVRGVAGFWAQGLSDQAATVLPSHGPGVRVAWATVAREVPLDGSRAQITVATTSTDDQTRYLAVPVAADHDGGLSVAGLPALVAPPPRGTTEVREPAALSGPNAGPVRDLVSRFLSAYLAGGSGSALSYFLAPGTGLVQMPKGLRVVSVGRVARDPHPTGGTGTPVLVAARVRDTTTRTVYPLAYHLRVVHRGRWYINAVSGGVGA